MLVLGPPQIFHCLELTKAMSLSTHMLTHLSLQPECHSSYRPSIVYSIVIMFTLQPQCHSSYQPFNNSIIVAYSSITKDFAFNHIHT